MDGNPTSFIDSYSSNFRKRRTRNERNKSLQNEDYDSNKSLTDKKEHNKDNMYEDGKHNENDKYDKYNKHNEYDKYNEDDKYNKHNDNEYNEDDKFNEDDKYTRYDEFDDLKINNFQESLSKYEDILNLDLDYSEPEQKNQILGFLQKETNSILKNQQRMINQIIDDKIKQWKQRESQFIQNSEKELLKVKFLYKK